MKNAFITTTKELPDWFKLENYLKAKDVEHGADGWHYELEARLGLRNILRSDENSHKHWSLARSWEKIKKFGLLSYAESDEFDIRAKEILDSKFKSIPDDEPTNKSEEECFLSIQTLNNFEAYGFLWFSPMRDEFEKKFNVNFIDDFSKTDSATKKDAFGWLWERYPCSSFWDQDNKAYVKLNLNASDEQIKNDFAKWLAHERKLRNMSPAKKNFTASDFASWHEAAVLPYLDLTFWAEFEGVRIHQHVIAQAIFPDAYALGSDVDPLGKLKTTKKKVEALMNEEALKVLELQEHD